MIDARLAEFTRTGESDDYECIGDVNKPLVARSVCAFLNGNGGRVIVGATGDGRVTGLKNGSSALADVEEYLRERVQPVSAWSANVENLSGGDCVLVVDVPAGSSKPYLIDGQIWCRRGGATLTATPDDVSRIIRDRVRADERWERQVALGVTENDLDLAEVLAAAQEIQSRGRHTFADPKDPLRVLNELSLYSAGEFSNAAVVLFGVRPTAIFPQAAVRLTVYQTDKKGKKLLYDTVVEQHLFGSLVAMMEFIEARVGVESEFREGEWQRFDRPTYPLFSVREGLLNGLIHRDLSSPSGGMSVSVYPEEIRIWNFGALPDGWNPSNLTKDHPSLPRNPDIAHVCFLRGWIEKLGRGTQLISDEFGRAGLAKPVWESDVTGTSLTLVSRQKSRRAAERSLNKRQLAALDHLKQGDQITVAEYLELLGDDVVTERTARSDLNGLIEAGLMRRRGSGRSTFYQRTKQDFEG